MHPPTLIRGGQWYTNEYSCMHPPTSTRGGHGTYSREYYYTLTSLLFIPCSWLTVYNVLTRRHWWFAHLYHAVSFTSHVYSIRIPSPRMTIYNAHATFHSSLYIYCSPIYVRDDSTSTRWCIGTLHRVCIGMIRYGVVVGFIPLTRIIPDVSISVSEVHDMWIWD